MSRNYITGAESSGLGPDSPMEKGRRFMLHEMGRFELKSAGATGYKTWTPNFRGRIIGFLCLVDTVTTDTNADATLIPRIGGTNVTGGLITVADVNDGTNPVSVADKIFQTTLITAANTFKVGDTVDILYTVTNAFDDGAVRPILIVEAYEA